MTIQQIRYALMIAQTTSMNKAAEKLFVSQPSLTTAIRELEKELGITIFFRSNKGVVPTSEGTEFLTYARQLLQQYEMIMHKYNDHNVRRKFFVSTQHYSFAVTAFIETVKQFGTSDYDFAIRDQKTMDVIKDVGLMRSEIGVIYLSDNNRRIITKFLNEHSLDFFKLVECQASVWISKNHPLAGKKSISMNDLKDYPCLSFDQGENGSLYFAEEILGENIYNRTIRACDRATMIDLMHGLNGYTLCSGITTADISKEDYVVIPFKGDSENPNSTMEIGYIKKRQVILSDICLTYIEELKNAITNWEASLK